MWSPAEAIALLRQMKEARPWKHVFWDDDFSIGDRASILSDRLVGSRQVTDVYLAALALRRGGRLVTFDTGAAWQAVNGGSKALIEVPAL